MGGQYPFFVSFRIDEATARLLATVAEAAGLKPNAWVRAQLLRLLGSKVRAPAVRRTAANAELLGEVLSELRAHGRNLNQLARLANGTGSLVSVAADIATMTAATEALMARVLDLLKIEEDA
ncbi:plasmid mobilization relaxosome protein MobC [uncultured Bosea sp.]|uniref:plasmid mobilization protein n=1 Tax=uncultured Bosea sp. TaxID=211457 RepID=UPI0025E0BE38|nr:plasmid mobilization relaxosome protein MobC [uncultured Bosea sp.]